MIDFKLPAAIISQKGEFTPEDIVALGFDLQKVRRYLKIYLENRIIAQTKLSETYIVRK
jgi:transcription initiation factor IIE alpha subunit